MSKRLAFVIHDLNPWGGQDKSTLEIARYLSEQWPLEVYAYTYEGMAASASSFHPVRPHIRRPVLAKSALFHLCTLARFGFAPRLGAEPKPIVHATGACSLVSDVVQVQFVHARWKEVLSRLESSPSIPKPTRTTKQTIRDLYHRFMLKYDSMIEKQVYQAGKVYIAISKNVAEDLRKYFGIRDSIHVIHHGVDANAFCPSKNTDQKRKLRESLNIPLDAVVTVFVGAYERKGLKVAIESLALLPESARERVVLLAVGNGNTEYFSQHARELGVASQVLLRGHTKEVLQYYQAADIFLLPTLYEAFGLVILEAMAAGLAPIVSRDAGASELIHEKESGLLIQNPESATEVAQHWKRLIEDDALRTAMGNAARGVAVNRPWSKVASEYAEVLKPLIEA